MEDFSLENSLTETRRELFPRRNPCEMSGTSAPADERSASVDIRLELELEDATLRETKKVLVESLAALKEEERQLKECLAEAERSCATATAAARPEGA